MTFLNPNGVIVLRNVIEKFYKREMSFFIEVFVENHEKSQFRN